jgi:hypothetical protein
MCLIGELRAKHEKIIAGAHRLSNFLENSERYAQLRDEFAKRTGRCDNEKQTLDPQKRRECSILFAFLIEYPRLPARRICLGTHPDFRFSLGRRRIGMEMVEAFVPAQPQIQGETPRGNILKHQEQLQDEIVEQAMQLHASAGGKPMRMNAVFARTNFRKRDIARVAGILSSLVPRKVTSPIVVKGNHQLTGWPPWLNQLHISSRPKAVRDRAHWSAAHGGCVHGGESILSALIQKKEEKLPSYRRARCNEYWLLIYIDGTSACSFVELNEDRSIFVTQFDQVFVFSPSAEAERRVIRLNAHKGSPNRASQSAATREQLLQRQASFGSLW